MTLSEAGTACDAAAAADESPPRRSIQKKKKTKNKGTLYLRMHCMHAVTVPPYFLCFVVVTENITKQTKQNSTHRGRGGEGKGREGKGRGGVYDI